MRDKEKLKKDGELEKRWRRKSTEGGKTRRKTERDEKEERKDRDCSLHQWARCRWCKCHIVHLERNKQTLLNVKQSKNVKKNQNYPGGFCEEPSCFSASSSSLPVASGPGPIE